MTDDALTDEIDESPDTISQIEARIERLAEAAERCRKFILASKIAIALGFALLAAIVLGALWASATSLLGSIALVLGGIVSLGSNISTLRQVEENIADAEAMRAELIGGIALKLVHDAPPTLM